VKLFPRLPSRFAEGVFVEQSELPFGEVVSATSHRFMIWPATGADRVTKAELERLSSSLREVAVAHGYPGTLAHGDQTAVDLALARALWQTAEPLHVRGRVR